MRILIACPYAWDAQGGVQVHVRELAEHLRARDHEVLVLAPGASRPSEPWVRIVGRPIRVPYGGKVAPICFSRSSWRAVREALRVFEPDVVHAHEPLSPSTSMLAVRASTAPVVATFHAFHERSRLMDAAAPVLRTVSRRIVAGMAVSQAAADFAARVSRRGVEIVPNGVDVDLFAHPGPPADGLPSGRKLLWVNRLDPQKGFPVLIRAFARLAREFPDLSLVVAGEGRDRDALGLLDAEERRRVVLLGAVPHANLPRYHAAADVFAAPATGHESFGMVLLEAMAAGLPVVASDIAGYREVVRDEVEGLLVRAGDPGALAAAVRRVLSDAPLAERLKVAGRLRAEGFAWARIVPLIEGAYRAAIGREAAGPLLG